MPGAIRPAAPRPPFSAMRPASSQVPRVMSAQRVGEFDLCKLQVLDILFVLIQNDLSRAFITSVSQVVTLPSSLVLTK